MTKKKEILLQPEVYFDLANTFLAWKKGKIDKIDRDIRWLRTGFNFNDQSQKERYLVMLQTNPEEFYLVLWNAAWRIANEK